MKTPALLFPTTIRPSAETSTARPSPPSSCSTPLAVQRTGTVPDALELEPTTLEPSRDAPRASLLVSPRPRVPRFTNPPDSDHLNAILPPGLGAKSPTTTDPSPETA